MGAAAVFIFAQMRGGHPMVPLDLFRSRIVSVALTVGFLNMAGFYGVVFLQGPYFQQLRGASPLTAGLLFLPMTGLVAVLSPYPRAPRSGSARPYRSSPARPVS